MISKFDHRKLALSMSSTNVGKNHNCSISLILMLEQNILITITLATISIHPKFQVPVDFSSCLAHFFVLKRLLPVSLIGLYFSFCVSKGRIHARVFFLLILSLFPITQGLFLPKFIARIRSWKPYLMFVCSFKRVLGSLQVGRSNRFPAIIETPGTLLILVHYQCIFDALDLPTTLL